MASLASRGLTPGSEDPSLERRQVPGRAAALDSDWGYEAEPDSSPDDEATDGPYTRLRPLSSPLGGIYLSYL